MLTLIFNELILIIKKMGKGLASYVADLMVKCKVQKAILHCILSSVHYFTMKITTTLSERGLKFNDLGSASGAVGCRHQVGTRDDQVRRRR